MDLIYIYIYIYIKEALHCLRLNNYKISGVLIYFNYQEIEYYPVRLIAIKSKRKDSNERNTFFKKLYKLS